jgi:hypothetical protein
MQLLEEINEKEKKRIEYLKKKQQDREKERTDKQFMAQEKLQMLKQLEQQHIAKRNAERKKITKRFEDK